MPLIFAIDSDKRQSAQLASLLRSHVEADLVQSASVKDGLAALRDRVPDLILTSSLLSPRDETALDKHLRKLGVAAAHVQTLTIPVMATAAASKKKPAGVLAKLRREKAASAKPSGCDPEVFASEVRGYLERAVEQREALRAALPATAPPEPAAVETPPARSAGNQTLPSEAEPARFSVQGGASLVMLAPTVVALVVKQPPTAAELEPVTPVFDVEAPAPIAETPLLVDAPAPEPEPPLISVLLPEPVAESHFEEPIFSILAEPAMPEPPTADPIADLLAVPEATVDAADQLLSATAPAVEEVVAAIAEPVIERVAKPVVEPVAEPVIELVAEPVIEAGVEPIASEPAENAESGIATRSWTFDAQTEPPLLLDQLIQMVVEPVVPAVPVMPEPEPEPEPPQEVASAGEAVVAPEAPGPQDLEPAEFAELLAPPPTRIADAIRMPEEGRIPTLDMGECEDLDSLASRFAAPIAAESPVPAIVDAPPVPAVEAVAVEAVVEAVVEAAVEEVAAEPAVERPVVEAMVEAAAPETPVIEAVVEPEAPEPPRVETVVEEARAIETMVADESPVEMVFGPPPGAATPVPEAPMPVWSWLEDAVTPLADLLSNALGRRVEREAEPEPVTEPEPTMEPEPATELEAAMELEPAVEPVPTVEAEPAVVSEEIYDPEASASWNLTAAAFSNRPDDESAVQPVEMRSGLVAEAPRDVGPVAVAEAGTFDPVSASAWEAAAVAPSVVLDYRPALAAPVAAEPEALRAPMQVAAPEPEQEKEPASAPVPEADMPSLDPDVLALLGMAAHRAGLDAMESLESAPERSRNGDGPVAGGKKTRQERVAQSRNQRRESKADRKARRKQERPAQDEWGMFDPTQCGPDALFDVDEWTDDEDNDDRRRPAQVR